MESEVLSTTQVMELLKVSRQTVWREVVDGRLRPVPESAVRPGWRIAAYRFTRAEIERYLHEESERRVGRARTSGPLATSSSVA